MDKGARARNRERPKKGWGNASQWQSTKRKRSRLVDQSNRRGEWGVKKGSVFGAATPRGINIIGYWVGLCKSETEVVSEDYGQLNDLTSMSGYYDACPTTDRKDKNISSWSAIKSVTINSPVISRVLSADVEGTLRNGRDRGVDRS